MKDGPFGRSLLLLDGDLVVRDGRLAEVAGVDNLLQALELRVLTPYGSDEFNVSYGLDVTEAFTRAHSARSVREVLKLNLVRTLVTDPRVVDVRQITFDESDEARHLRNQSVRVELDTVAEQPATLVVTLGV
ncbi:MULTISPECIES: hypothetical protein [Streptomycetaceae]|uniref:hypothetical protein n=1 Tax=Streptomycetaceae TaxID=2062 RepID=UPI0004C02760|nr:hypothetical protein [Streptomyces sp. NRRL S-350]